MSEQRLKGKVDLLGLFFLISGGLQVCVALFMGVMYGLIGTGIGVAGVMEGEGEAMVVGGSVFSVGICIAVFVLVFAVPTLMTGRALRKQKRWARIAALVLGALGILNVPIGTALGVYAFVVLLDKEIDSVLTE